MIDHHDSKGLSLIEIMFSIAIIAIGIFAVMSLIIIVVKGNKHSNKVTTATTMAQDKIEEFKNMDYDEITGTYTVYSGYYMEVDVENDIPGTNTKTVTVNVYWNPGTATSAHKVELKTILAQ